MNKKRSSLTMQDLPRPQALEQGARCLTAITLLRSEASQP